MTKKAKTILWSIVGGVAALTLVGVYVFRPGKKSTTAGPTPAPLTNPAPSAAAATSAGQKIVTATSDNINLRSSPAASSSSLSTESKNTYLGTLIATVPDGDGKKDASGKVYQWAYVQPWEDLDISQPFYVRTDLVMIN